MKPAFLFAIAGLVSAGFFGYNSIYLPKQKEVRVIEARSAQEQASQDAEHNIVSVVRQAEQYRKRLPPEPDPSWLVREVVALSQKSGIQLSTITPESPQDASQYTRLGVSLQFTTSYHHLGALIDAVESSPLYIHIDRLELAPVKPDDEHGGNLAVRLTLGTMYVPSMVKRAPGS